MIYEQGDIVLVDFEPQRGHEPNKYRPALVVSASGFNVKSALTVVCPITSANNGYPMHVELPLGHDTTGYICVEQMKALDLNARRCEFVETANIDTMNQVLNLIGAVFDI